MKHSSRSRIASHMPGQKPDDLAAKALKISTNYR
ncbi:hypothetical protein DespoDRAFT_03235 [Desulfobacter postgatei 2ac9]|uniref:Uncharacterized protein n=1 Tax=Desulfobacter postgatei 2ac9 TaxID=879212 RepID=I5B6A3_9BACT|nr:hypothetical protein DespoDRAFT_03235 [Desulfobacter postgatei 2ac9]